MKVIVLLLCAGCPTYEEPWYSRISKREPSELESGENTEDACSRKICLNMKKNCVWLLPPASC